MYPDLSRNEFEKMKNEFTLKDSGKRIEYPSGMRRDVQDDKPIYTLIYRPFLKRFAEHLTRGAKKYGRNNWREARSREEFERFRDSAMRHLIQWLEGERDEDHALAVVFNIMGAEYVRERLVADGKEAEVEITERGSVVGGSDVARPGVAAGKGDPNENGIGQPYLRKDAVLPHVEAGRKSASLQKTAAALPFAFYIAGSLCFITGLPAAFGGGFFIAGSMISLAKVLR